jgi:hypothetical protein
VHKHVHKLVVERWKILFFWLLARLGRMDAKIDTIGLAYDQL